MATITAALVKKRLQIANACASKKGYNYIVNYVEKGKKNDAILKEIELLVDLIDILLVYSRTIEGVDVVDMETCLTKDQINNVLNKICSICDAPCTSYVNFA